MPTITVEDIFLRKYWNPFEYIYTLSQVYYFAAFIVALLIILLTISKTSFKEYNDFNESIGLRFFRSTYISLGHPILLPLALYASKISGPIALALFFLLPLTYKFWLFIQYTLLNFRKKVSIKKFLDLKLGFFDFLVSSLYFSPIIYLIPAIILAGPLAGFAIGALLVDLPQYIFIPVTISLILFLIDSYTIIHKQFK